MLAVTKDGRDSVYKKKFNASKVKFYIDQAQGLIYNPDSLPYGTDVAHVLTKVSTRLIMQNIEIPLDFLSLFRIKKEDSAIYSHSLPYKNLTNIAEYQRYNTENCHNHDTSK